MVQVTIKKYVGTSTSAWSDITDRFEILDEQLLYHDAPYEGYLKALDSGQLFAFRVEILIKDLLFHWTLYPVSSLERLVEEVFESAARESLSPWISVVEDRRMGKAVLTAVELELVVESIALPS